MMKSFFSTMPYFRHITLLLFLSVMFSLHVISHFLVNHALSNLLSACMLSFTSRALAVCNTFTVPFSFCGLFLSASVADSVYYCATHQCQPVLQVNGNPYFLTTFHCFSAFISLWIMPFGKPSRRGLALRKYNTKCTVSGFENLFVNEYEGKCFL